MQIGEKIRERRKALGWSLQRVGDLVGVTRNAVHLWETGEVTEITLANRIKLSEALNMPLAELLPPEAQGDDMTIRDPEEVLLIERFRSLLKQQREAYLRLLVLMRGEEDPPGS